MNREIKYRALLRGQHFKGWVYWTVLDGYREYDIDVETVSQYTNLKDKNGVEIYDGDIIRKYNHNKPPNDYSDGKASKVHWDESTCGWNIRNPQHRKGSGGFEYVVIGNIYQNPELLTNR